MSENNCIRVYANVEQIQRCKKSLEQNDEQFKSLVKVLKLTGNDMRLKILFLLKEEGKMCPCDLSDILDISVPAVSQHLKKLKDASLVTSSRVAQTIYYSIENDQEEVLTPIMSFQNLKTI